MKDDDILESILRKVAWEVVQAKSFEEVKKILERPGLQQYIPRIREYAEEYQGLISASGASGKGKIKELENEILSLREEIDDLKKVGKIISTLANWAINILALLISLVGLAYTVLSLEQQEILKEYILQYLVEIVNKIK